MNKYQVQLMPDAIKDLEAIYLFIADNSQIPDVAFSYIQKLKQACLTLETAPLRGQKRDDLRENLRILPIDKKAIIAFDVDEDAKIVRILNIFYGGDYDTILNKA